MRPSFGTVLIEKAADLRYKWIKVIVAFAIKEWTP